MKLYLLIIIAVIFLSSTAAFAQSAPLPSEFQSWNELQLILPLARGKDVKGKTIDKITATFNGTLRIGRNNLDFLDNRLGATIDFRVNRHLSLTTATLYRKDKLVKNVRRYETRFNVGGTFSETLHNFTFRDRNLYEHRFRNSRSDLNVYRQRFQASYSWKRNKKEIFAPFISEEGFYDLKLNTWFRNEFYAGISHRLNRKTAIDIAYVRTDTRPVNVNGLNVILKIKLR
ncbi:MAG: DUF2490 domain-containing protein [Pyrinomonadaceae bacterium]